MFLIGFVVFYWRSSSHSSRVMIESNQASFDRKEHLNYSIPFRCKDSKFIWLVCKGKWVFASLGWLTHLAVCLFAWLAECVLLSLRLFVSKDSSLQASRHTSGDTLKPLNLKKKKKGKEGKWIQWAEMKRERRRMQWSGKEIQSGRETHSSVPLTVSELFEWIWTLQVKGRKVMWWTSYVLKGETKGESLN